MSIADTDPKERFRKVLLVLSQKVQPAKQNLRLAVGELVWEAQRENLVCELSIELGDFGVHARSLLADQLLPQLVLILDAGTVLRVLRRLLLASGCRGRLGLRAGNRREQRIQVRV